MSEFEYRGGSNIKVKKIFVFLSLFFLVINGFAQKPTQTIRGKVLDTDTELALVGATVELLKSDLTLGTSSDEKGNFRFENLEVGWYELKASYLGYETLTVTEVLVESGKEVVLEFRLQQTESEIAEVLVKGERTSTKVLNPVSTYTLTLEETLRFPATFYDPARLAMEFAGVTNVNDQANAISIRGNSPNNMNWQLEGVQIVNPNHLSNAGTFSDRSMQNSGGVNILSAQLLSTSYFLTDAFPSQYGNSLSGVMDMRLREGNNERYEFTAQAGLIGLDVAAEGPISKNSDASFLVNYRYSTLGLLSAMGVDLGDEAITFQDISFNLSFPTQKAGKFTIFGMAGISENVFEAERDSSVWEFEKDRYDITFDSKMGAVGATHTLPIGSSSVLKTVIAYSALENNRIAKRLSDEFLIENFETDNSEERNLAFSTTFNHKINKSNRFDAGLDLNQLDYEIFAIDGLKQTLNGSGKGTLLQPFFNYETKRSDILTFNLGLRFQYFTFNKSQSIEPRSSLSFHLPKNQNLSLAYGIHSKLQLPQLYFADIGGGNPNESLGFTKAHHFVLAYEKTFKQTFKLRGEVYFQSLFDVPIIDDKKSSFSALNMLENFVTDTLVNNGTGENYGLEISLSKNFTGNYFLLVNGTFYESKYTGGDGIQRDTRYNGNYIFNLTGGKEFHWDKGKKNKVLGVNAHLIYRGGFRETPIDIENSAAAGKTIYVEEEAFSIQQKDYFRIDLRIYYKKNKPKYTSTLALDIQNLTNNENAAFSYYDAQKGELVVKNQLGLIPILSYRIEF
jgi:Carboxypeptidase regulatory-like domain